MAWALQFDGVNDLVNIASPVTIGFGNDGSISVPFKRTDTSNGQALFGDQSGTNNICQILNASQVFFRVNGSSVTFNLTTSLVLDGEYVFKFKRVSNTWSLVDEFDSSLAPETVGNNNTVTINQIGAFNGGTLFHGRMDGFIVEELGIELQSLINTTGTSSTWTDSIGSADGALVSFPTDDSQWVNLGGSGISVTGDTAAFDFTALAGTVDLAGEILVTGSTASFDYSAISGAIDLTGQLLVTGQTANFDYSAINGGVEFTGEISVTGDTASFDYIALPGTIDLTGEIIVTGSTANFDYTGENGVIELGAVINVVGQTANFDVNGVNAEVLLTGEITIVGDTATFDYIAKSGIVVIGEGQKIGTVTAGFANSTIGVQYKQNTITVNFGE